MNKSEIRKRVLKLRKKNYLYKTQFNFKSVINILKKKKYTKKNIGGYFPYNYEVNILPILERFENLNYSLLLPKIDKNSQMNFFNWSTKDPLNINQYGIPEPITSKIKYPDVLLVPLVAYDKNFNRIGYGGGFYDRYIKRIKKIKKIITIGIAYSFQRVDKVPVDKYDIKLDFIITEKAN